MTSSTQQQRQQPHSFWTTRRVSFTFIVLALLATLGVSSCSQSENVSTTTTTTNSRATTATAPASNAAPAKTQPPTGNVAVATVNNNAAPPTTAAPPAAGGALPSIPMPAAMFSTPLKTIDGKTFKLSDYKGKVVIINLWASWCGPCRVETPELIKMSQEYKARGAEFIGLTTKGNDPEIEPIKEFVSEQQVPYKIIWDDGSFAGPLSQLVRARAVVPQSYVLLRNGNIYKHFEGFNSTETPRKLREAIEQALNSQS